MNKYRKGAGARWAVMTRYDIPDMLNPDQIYLTRWRLIQTPWLGIYLHAIRMPDPDRNLHDHPWNFVSFILRGGYVESHLHSAEEAHTWNGVERVYRQGSINRKRIGEFHTIKRLMRRPTWTLVFVGRRQKDWGFLTERGWVQWAEYLGVTDEPIEAA